MRCIVPCALLCGLLAALSAYGMDAAMLDSEAGVAPRFDVMAADGRGVKLEFELSELSAATLTEGGQEFQFVSIPGGGFTGEVGEPAVPVYSKLVAIPPDVGVRVRAIALEEETWTDQHLMPIQPGEPNADFAYDPVAYARPGLDDGEWVQVSEPQILRDLRVVNVTLQPVRYDPAGRTLQVARRLQVEIEFVGTDERNARPLAWSTIPPSFDALYRQAVVNYEGPAADQSVLPGSCLIICYNNSGVVDRLQPLVEWRQRKGHPTTLVTTADTGTSASSIKNYIQGFYNSNPLEYVVLVGDASGTYSLPTWFENLSGYNGEGDHPYTQLAGGDLLPDVHIGRLSFDGTLNQLTLLVNKVIGYESTPDLSDPGWFTRGCVVGDPSSSGQSCVISGQWLKTRLLDIGYTQVDTVWSGNFVSQMGAALNQGDTIFTYRGWLGMSGWGNTNTYTLQNGWKMPYAVILTCGTGSFANGTARSEGFLRAGTAPSSPRGGIGSIGTATTGTHTRYNNCMYYGILRGLLVEGLSTMGASLSRGKLEMYNNYFAAEPSKVQIWMYWNNLMGDPAVDIFTAYPAALTVGHPASLAVGANAVTVTVAEGGSPLAEALVCLWQGQETYAVGYTDVQGIIELPVAATSSGDMLLTVTKHNKHPYLTSIPVGAQNVYVGFETATIDDDTSGTSSGNGNGVVNPLETIELPVQLRNFGISSASTVTATLTSTDPYVTIADGAETFGTIAGGGVAWSADDFDFSVAADCPDGHPLRFGLDVSSGASDWHSLIDLEVVSADLIHRTMTLYNSGNGRLDPGETLEMSIEVINNGGMSGSGILGTLTSLSPFVSVTDDSGSFGTIGIGGNGSNSGDRFTISASVAAYEGHLASLLITYEFSGGVVDTSIALLTVGQRGTDDPVGPDAYGYYAFDNTDSAYPEAPTYGWIELDPTYGGDGTEVVLGDYGTYQDKSRIINLPFTFQYYGEEFDQVTVNSNGWVSMGSTYLTSYRNWTIPGAGGPAGMIAPFWDNLYQNTAAKAFQKYDAAGGRWIIEWSRFKNDYNGATETFEVILYDPVVHPTDSGDGIIEFQYETVSNYDPTNGYATVGIESPDMLDGLLYTYWNNYAGGAATLAAGRAIKFLPVMPGPRGTLQGQAMNVSYSNAPIEGVQVAVLGAARVFTTAADGRYGGAVAPGAYDVAAYHVSFEPDTVSGVEIRDGEATVLDFYLTDVAPPVIATTTHGHTSNQTGPYPIPVTIIEYSGVTGQTLYYRSNGGPFNQAALTPQGGNDYLAEIPGQPYTTAVEYYVHAEDTAGYVSVDPPGAPLELHIFYVAPMDVVLDDAFESAAGWTIGAPDDDATTGIWVREEPVGTEYNSNQIQPDFDHTPAPGEICFVTANAAVGAPAGEQDIDGGKTTIFSPVFDLDGFTTAAVSYWLYYTNNLGINPGEEDTWLVEVTDDGNTWVSLESTTQSPNDWVERSFVLDDYVELTSNVQLRFVASDYGLNSLVEAALDDFLLTGMHLTTGMEGDGAPPVVSGLDRVRPNPFNPATSITYHLATPGTVKLRIFDVAGRVVTTLVDELVPAGRHEVRWNGRNAAGQACVSGVYFLRLDAPDLMQVRQMTLVR